MHIQGQFSCIQTFLDTLLYFFDTFRHISTKLDYFCEGIGVICLLLCADADAMATNSPLDGSERDDRKRDCEVRSHWSSSVLERNVLIATGPKIAKDMSAHQNTIYWNPICVEQVVH
jgi:hypothetical protein